jgi:hypothetical protein
VLRIGHRDATRTSHLQTTGGALFFQLRQKADAAKSRPVNPDTQCEVLVDANGIRQWVRDSAQSVFVAGAGSWRR